MKRLLTRCVKREWRSLTSLYVGAGTFQPVRADSLADHRMHHEWMEISKAVCDAIAECRKNNGRVIAVGTTVMCCLETATKKMANAAFMLVRQVYLSTLDFSLIVWMPC